MSFEVMEEKDWETNSTYGNELTPLNRIKAHKSFADCRYDVPSRELNLVLGMMSLVKEDDGEFKTHKFSISTLADFLGLNYDKRCREVRKIIENLDARKITIYEKGLPIRECPTVRWFARCQISESKDFAELKLNTELSELLLTPDISKNYIASQMHIFLSMKSEYSKKIYILLLKNFWKSNGKIKNNKFEISIEELRDILQVGDAYPLPGNFKARIIDKARSECAAHANLTFECDSVIKGKTTWGYQFTIHENPNYKHVEIKLKPDSSRTTGMERLDEIINQALREEHADVVKRLILAKISKAGIAEIITNCPMDRVKEVVDRIEDQYKKGVVKNLGGLIRTACKDIAQEVEELSEYDRILLAEQEKERQAVELQKEQEELRKKQEEEEKRKRELAESRANEYLDTLTRKEFSDLVDDFINNGGFYSHNVDRNSCFVPDSKDYAKLRRYVVDKKVDSN